MWLYRHIFFFYWSSYTLVLWKAIWRWEKEVSHLIINLAAEIYDSLGKLVQLPKIVSKQGYTINKYCIAPFYNAVSSHERKTRAWLEGHNYT